MMLEPGYPPLAKRGAGGWAHALLGRSGQAMLHPVRPGNLEFAAAFWLIFSLTAGRTNGKVGDSLQSGKVVW